MKRTCCYVLQPAQPGINAVYCGKPTSYRLVDDGEGNKTRKHESLCDDCKRKVREKAAEGFKLYDVSTVQVVNFELDNKLYELKFHSADGVTELFEVLTEVREGGDAESGPKAYLDVTGLKILATWQSAPPPLADLSGFPLYIRNQLAQMEFYDEDCE